VAFIARRFPNHPTRIRRALREWSRAKEGGRGRGRGSGAGFYPFGAARSRSFCRRDRRQVTGEGGELIICLFYVSWPGQTRALLSCKLSCTRQPGLTVRLHSREHAPRSFEMGTLSRSPMPARYALDSLTRNGCKGCKLAGYVVGWKEIPRGLSVESPRRGGHGFLSLAVDNRRLNCEYNGRCSSSQLIFQIVRGTAREDKFG